MVYLLSITTIQLLALTLSGKALRRAASGESTPHDAALTMLSVLAPAMLLGAPLVVELAKADALAHGGAIALDELATHLWLTGIGSVLGVAIFGWRLWRQRRTDSGFLSVGCNVLGILISLHMVYVWFDQIAFFGQRTDVGLVNWEYFREGRGYKTFIAKVT